MACDVFNGSSPSHGYLIVRPSNFYKIVFDIEIFIQVINLQSNDGLAWNCSITSAYALEILQYCAKATISSAKFCPFCPGAEEWNIFPWWPLLRLLSQYPIFKSSHCNHFKIGHLFCHLWVPIFQMHYRDFTTWQGTRIIAPAMATRWHIPGAWFNIKMKSYQYRKSHCGDKTILRPSYLHNGIPNTGKMTSLYWIRAQNTTPWHLDHLILKPRYRVLKACMFVSGPT